MESLPLPKTYTFIKEEGDESVFVLEPCYPGYGVTIGNAIRRVLLSSLPGAAVTAVKIKGVDHEFSTVPNVKEDVIDIILNLKKLCIKSYSDEPVRLHLKAKGDKEITAGMIETPDQVEIVNKNLHIATLDGASVEFEMELIVNQGRGYVPVEAREEEKLEIGMIAVDAIYTPVRGVNFTVENVRVGKMTNYDRLTLSITTNGTMSGREALDQSARILLEHFQLLTKDLFERAPAGEETAAPEAMEEPTPAAEQTPTAEAAPAVSSDDADSLLALNLSRRSHNALMKNGITKVSQLNGLTAEQLRSFDGLGEKSVTEILEAIKGL